jgi:hypothetical protein
MQVPKILDQSLKFFARLKMRLCSLALLAASITAGTYFLYDACKTWMPPAAPRCRDLDEFGCSSTQGCGVHLLTSHPLLFCFTLGVLVSWGIRAVFPPLAPAQPLLPRLPRSLQKSPWFRKTAELPSLVNATK